MGKIDMLHLKHREALRVPNTAEERESHETENDTKKERLIHSFTVLLLCVC